MTKYVCKKKLRDFGLIIGFGLPIFIGWIIPLLSGHIFRVWTLWASLPFLFLSFISPSLLLYPYKLWMQIGLVLGWINSRIILGIIFILVLQPIAVLMKFFKYDPLSLKKNSNKSYREDIKKSRIDLDRIF